MADGLQIFNSLGANFEGSDALSSAAKVEYRAGNASAPFLYGRMLSWRCYRRFIHPPRPGSAVENLFAISDPLARYDEAEERAREMLTIARERREDVYAAIALQHLGAIAALRPPAAAEGGAGRRSHSRPDLGLSDARITALGSARHRGPPRTTVDVRPARCDGRRHDLNAYGRGSRHDRGTSGRDGTGSRARLP